MDVKRYGRVMEYIEKLTYEEQVALWLSIDVESKAWPVDLPYKPDDWDKLGASERARWLVAFRNGIESIVGRKAVFRHKKRMQLGWNDKQFEDWWEGYATRRLIESLEEELKNGYGNRKNRSGNGNYGYYAVCAAAAFCLGCLFAFFFCKFI